MKKYLMAGLFGLLACFVALVVLAVTPALRPPRYEGSSCTEGEWLMEKTDLRKELKHLYAPSAKEVEVVDVPRLNFIMIDGQIEPGETPRNVSWVPGGNRRAVRPVVHAQVHVEIASREPQRLHRDALGGAVVG